MILGKEGAPYLLKDSSITDGASMESSLHLVISERQISAVIWSLVDESLIPQRKSTVLHVETKER